MRTNEQALTAYTKERAELVGQIGKLQVRLSALDGVIAGLEVMTGKRTVMAKRRSSGEATGTKADILDTLADGKSRSLKEIAAACKVSDKAAVRHIAQLVEAGDVLRQGKSRATRYRIP